MRGRLITIEGLDGAGKTTLAAGLLPTLPANAELLREPGGVTVSERIRDLVKDPAHMIHARAEALLYAAARAELIDAKLEPLLAQGTHVLLDRFVDSSLAYQGAGRELGIEEIAAINRFATGGLRPDRTLLLRIDPQEGRARQHDRGQSQDRLERESDAFFARIAAAYDALAAAEPNRIRTLDAGLPRGLLLAAARDAIADLF